MTFRTWLENEYWHGSPKSFDRFEYTFLGTGRGHDQHGPGFYFTSKESDAKNYGGNLIKANLTLNKTVPLRGRPKVKEIRWLMQQAPDLADTLTNWNEDPRQAFQDALAAMLNQENPHQAFQQVWYDFYRGHEAEYLKNMTTLGYDGVVIPGANDITHVVMFSPDKIEVIR